MSANPIALDPIAERSALKKRLEADVPELRRLRDEAKRRLDDLVARPEKLLAEIAAAGDGKKADPLFAEFAALDPRTRLARAAFDGAQSAYAADEARLQEIHREEARERAIVEVEEKRQAHDGSAVAWECRWRELAAATVAVGNAGNALNTAVLNLAAHGVNAPRPKLNVLNDVIDRLAREKRPNASRFEIPLFF